MLQCSNLSLRHRTSEAIGVENCGGGIGFFEYDTGPGQTMRWIRVGAAVHGWAGSRPFVGLWQAVALS